MRNDLSWMQTSLFNLIKQFIRLQFPTVRPIQTADLAHWLESSTQPQPILLDARTPPEFAVSHLPTAQFIDSSSSHNPILETLPKDAPIVVYCSVGYRSAKLAQQLQQQGFACVFNLEGSIFQWANEERPVYQADRLTSLVHPYNDTWGKLLNAHHRAQCL